MESLAILLAQILSPPILFFVAGIVAALIKSNLKIPESMNTAMVLFLLCAIGLKGGVGLSKVGVGAMPLAALAAAVLGAGIVLLGYLVLTRLKFDAANAGAIAGHYGAVSMAVMVLGFAFLDGRNVPYEAFIPALYPVMAGSAIVTAIFLTRFALAKKVRGATKLNKLKVLKESIAEKVIPVLIASLLIGFIGGVEGTAGIMPFFDGMFSGVLCLFMLDMGLLAAARLREWKIVGLKLTAYAYIMPLIHGIMGVLLGTLIGLSVGGATMLGVMAGSASFVAAPPAMRAAIPEANPSLSLVASVALTFPFIVVIGIPLYYMIAQTLA